MHYELKVFPGVEVTGVSSVGARIIVEEHGDHPLFGMPKEGFREVLALRHEPGGTWVTEGVLDQTSKGESLCIAAKRDLVSGAWWTGKSVEIPYSVEEARALMCCCQRAYEVADTWE